MRLQRLKVDPAQEDGWYHCMSRTVNGALLFGRREKTRLCEEIRKVAQFCGVEILSYIVMGNHFHILIKVPKKEFVSDMELLKRFRILNGDRSLANRRRIAAFEKDLEEGRGALWREKLLKQMGDVSAYMKLLKQRFTQYYNRLHRRFGPLWSDRFKSILVEDGEALTAMSGYIGHNSVKAGLAKEPWDYEFSSFAEADRGSEAALIGLEQVSESYRALRSTKISGGILGSEAYVRLQAQKLGLLERRKRHWIPTSVGLSGLSSLWKTRE